MILAADATSLIHVEIMVDNWPQEIGWSITDDMGNVVEEVTKALLAVQKATSLNGGKALLPVATRLIFLTHTATALMAPHGVQLTDTAR